ncbi:phiSA1p31-related protein [Streptomyces sp. NPDC006527]|uniref:phiSA1p31-related protein n=1 Tax=Streptomyces sp. NPDC006527 TaxID=3364749 RepID=UPI0036CC4DAC
MTDRPMIGMDVGADGEPVIVVVVQADGSHTVRTDAVCKVVAAELLRGIADRLHAEHGPQPCTPQYRGRSDAEQSASPYAGRLDRERRVWHDPRGDSWDLTLTWADWTEREWRWHGTTGLGDEPILRSEDGDEAQPLGVLRALYGPIAPVLRGAA